MVDSPSKRQKPARYKFPSSENLFLVRVVIYIKLEEYSLVIIQIIKKSFEFESVQNVGACIMVRIEYGEEASMREWKRGGAVTGLYLKTLSALVYKLVHGKDL